MTVTRYNPLNAALKAAWSELTCDDAIVAYDLAAWATVQRACDDSIITVTYAVYAVHAFGCLALECGALFRRQVWEGYHTGDLPAAPVRPALAPETTAIAVAQSVALVGADDDVIEAEVIEAPILPNFGPVALLCAAVTPAPCDRPKARNLKPAESFPVGFDLKGYKRWMRKSRPELRKACTAAGLSWTNRDRRSDLARKLVSHRYKGVGIA